MTNAHALKILFIMASAALVGISAGAVMMGNMWLMFGFIPGITSVFMIACNLWAILGDQTKSDQRLRSWYSFIY